MSYHEELRRKRHAFFAKVLFRLGLLCSPRYLLSLFRRAARAAGRTALGVWRRVRWGLGGKVKDLFRYWIPSAWRWLTNGGLRPWLKGPEFVEPDEFVSLVRLFRPGSLSHHLWHNPSSGWHTINFFFRKGRMIYATVLPFHLDKMGCYPDALPEAFFKFCVGGCYDHDVRSCVTRHPADLLNREPTRRSIPREGLSAA